MKILISGGSGRIGQFLIQNHFKGHIIATFGQGAGNDHDIDILDNAALTKLFNDFQPDIMIHLAGLIGKTCEENPDLANRVNVTATKNLAELAIKHHCSKFIFASSASVYNQTEHRATDETHNLDPQSVYGKSKLAAEAELKKLSGKSKMQIIVLRMFNIYGKQFADNLLTKLINSSPEQPVELIEPEAYYRDYIHISDIGKVFDVAVNTTLPDKFTILNVASGKAPSTSAILAMLESQGLKIYWKATEGKQSISWANIDRLKTCSKWNRSAEFATDR